MDKILEQYADNAFDANTKENSILWKKEWYEANFKKFFPENRRAELLDIGPGIGELLITEKEWGYINAHAVDLSPSIVQYCKNKGLDCEITDDTAKWLIDHSGRFDLITLLDVFEHIPQNCAIEFLQACRTALRDSGRLILQVPNIQSAEGVLHRYNDVTHVFGYSQHTLIQLISTAGFETVKFYPFEEYPGNDRDTKMIRRLRSIYWKRLRADRKITHNLDSEILTPELFAVLAKKKCELPEHSIEGEFEDHKISLNDVRDYLEKLGVESEAFEKICKIDELERMQMEQDSNWKKQFQTQNRKIMQSADHHMARLDEHNAWTRQRLDYLEKKVEKMDILLMRMRYTLRTLAEKMRNCIRQRK